MPIQPIIEVHNATKTFDWVTALDQMSFTVEEGEVIGLLGPNGSGKTTLIRLLCAYFLPTSGSVLVAGYDTEEKKTERVRGNPDSIAQHIVQFLADKGFV